MKLNSLDRVPAIPVQEKNIGKSAPAKSNDLFKKTFNEAIADKTGIKFSGHAIDRLSHRGVALDDVTVDRLNKAVSAAGKKGSDQSLVLLDELAFLVSVKNKTVITAMETNNMKEGVFTQIDSAVIG